MDLRRRPTSRPPRANLPPDTSYVVINGAVHSSFGDYGDQPGDGTATIDRAAAQAKITKAALALWPHCASSATTSEEEVVHAPERRGRRSLLPRIWV